MTKQYIRPCPVRQIGVALRDREYDGISPLYPCAVDADLVSNIWLVRCDCGIEFTCHEGKLISGEVTACGQCTVNGDIQQEVPYLDLVDCSDLLQFGEQTEQSDSDMV